MIKRIIFGLLMIILVAGLLWFDWHLEWNLGYPIVGLPVSILMMLLLAAGFFEMVLMAAKARLDLLVFSGVVGTCMLGTFPLWRQFLWPAPGETALLLVLGIILIIVFAQQMLRKKTGLAFVRTACTLMAVFYLGVGGAVILQMRMDLGVEALTMFLATVKFADIGAYFVGSAIGKHKLIPRISPGKSWEGLLGAIIFAAGMATLATWFFSDVIGLWMTLWQAAIFGAVIALAGQFADLCESMLKRSANVKDSGSLLPEFGGVLDIIDSPLLAAPVAYLALEFFSLIAV